MKIQTINQLVSVWKDIATRHYQINGFGVGDNWENGTTEKMHPVLWINPTNASMPASENGYKTFEIDFEVRLFDLVNKDESNENDVLSDTIDILKDIIAEFKGHPYYVNSQLNIIGDIDFEAFTEEFDEEVSGWTCEISLMTPVLTTFCGIPATDITGFEFPGVDCPDVNVLCPVFIEDVTGVHPIVVTTVGTTKEISIVGGGLSDTFVVSGSYNDVTDNLELLRNDGVTVLADLSSVGGGVDTNTFLLSGLFDNSTNDLELTLNDSTVVAINLADLKDNTDTNTIISSGVVNGDELTLTMDDLSTVVVDVTSLALDTNTDTNTIVSSGVVNGSDLTLTNSDSSTVVVDVTSLVGGGSGGGDNISNTDLTLDADRILDFNGNVLTLGGDTIVKGSDTSINTTGFKVTDFNDETVLDVKNNGQTTLGNSTNTPLILSYKGVGTFGMGLDFNARNDNDDELSFARIIQVATDVTAGSEDGGMWLRTMRYGTLTTYVKLDNNELLVDATDFSVNAFRIKDGGYDPFRVTTDRQTYVESGSFNPLVLNRKGSGNQGVGLDFNAYNSSSNEHSFARIVQVASSVSSGSEDGGLWLRVSDNGSISTKVQIDTDKTDIKNKLKLSGGLEVNGANGFTGTGNFTNFTIVDGIITNAT